MQYTLTINQAKATEWGLNAQQAFLFAFVYEVASWATPVTTDDGVFYALSKAKIVEELPLIASKADTAYRQLKELERRGVIDLSSTGSITLVRLTPVGQTWNRKLDGSEKYPKSAGKGRKKIRGGSEKNPRGVGNNSEPGSEKSPTNQDTSNQGTNQDTSDQVAAGDEPQPLEGELEQAAPDEPRVEIPADMPGPKDQRAKTFKPWANYAMAYRHRYGVWPIWNARTAGQLGQLVDRVGARLAPGVAAHFLAMNHQYYVAKSHPVGLMLQDCEAIATAMQTGQQMTATRARQMDGTQANASAADEAKRLLGASWED